MLKWPYENQGLDKTPFTKTRVWTKRPLQKPGSGQNCPYVSCIRRRIALTFSVFGAELHLHFLCSAQNRPYKNNGLDKMPLTKTVVWRKLPLCFLYSAQNCTYVFCIRRKTALTFPVFGAEPLLWLLCLAQNLFFPVCESPSTRACPREPVRESSSTRACPREPVRESLSARACPVVSLGGSEFQSIHGLGGPSVVLQFTTSQSAVYDQFTTNAAWGLASPSARACLREPVRESPSTRACPRERVRESRSATME